MPAPPNGKRRVMQHTDSTLRILTVAKTPGGSKMYVSPVWSHRRRPPSPGVTR